MTQNKSIYWLNAAVVCSLWLVILIFLNLTSNNKFWRVDLNQEQVFTLSELTTTTLQEKLSEKVIVTYYLSERALPRTAKFSTLRQDVEDLLAEYASLSDKFSYTVQDPIDGARSVSDELAKELRTKQGLFIVRQEPPKGTKGETFRFISSLKVRYADKFETINQLTEVGALEYELTRALKKLTAEDLPKVGLFASRSQHDLFPADTSKLQEVLEQVVDFETVRLGGEPTADESPRKLYEVPDDIDALLVVRPQNLDQKAAFAIDQFIMRGGRVVFMIESHSGAPPRGRFRRGREMQPTATGLEPLLRHYGVEQQKSFVFDVADPFSQRQIQRVPVGDEWVIQEVEVLFPFVFSTQRENHNARYPMVEQLDKLFLVLPSPLRRVGPTVGDEKNPALIRYESLVRSSDRSWAAQLESPQSVWSTFLDEAKLADTRIKAARDKKATKLDLAVLLQGKFTSYYGEGRELPDWARVAVKWKELKRKALEKELEEKARKKAAKAAKSGKGSGSAGGSGSGSAAGSGSGSEPGSGSGSGSAGSGSGSAAGSGSGSAAGSGSGSGSGSGAMPKPKPKPRPKIVVDEPVPPQRLTKCTEENRIIVIGDSDWATDTFIEWDENDNHRFVKNIVEWISADQALADLQSKRGRVRPLDEEHVEDWKLILILGMVGLAPLLVMLVGLAVWQLRRAELEEFERRVRRDHGES